jgi:hypothetical protein
MQCRAWLTLHYEMGLSDGRIIFLNESFFERISGKLIEVRKSILLAYSYIFREAGILVENILNIWSTRLLQNNMPNAESSKYALERAYLQSIVLFRLIESAHDVLFVQNAVSLHMPTTAYTIAKIQRISFFGELTM